MRYRQPQPMLGARGRSNELLRWFVNHFIWLHFPVPFTDSYMQCGMFQDNRLCAFKHTTMQHVDKRLDQSSALLKGDARTRISATGLTRALCSHAATTADMWRLSCSATPAHAAQTNACMPSTPARVDASEWASTMAKCHAVSPSFFIQESLSRLSFLLSYSPCLFFFVFSDVLRDRQSQRLFSLFCCPRVSSCEHQWFWSCCSQHSLSRWKHYHCRLPGSPKLVSLLFLFF